jgi:addiction module HigA family antidote
VQRLTYALLMIGERRGISADTAMRLARYFGGNARSWLNLQAAYDLRVAELSSAKRIAREVSPAAA